MLSSNLEEKDRGGHGNLGIFHRQVKDWEENIFGYGVSEEARESQAAIRKNLERTPSHEAGISKNHGRGIPSGKDEAGWKNAQGR